VVGRINYAPLVDISVASDATQDLWSLMAGDYNKCILHGWEISSNGIAAVAVSLTLNKLTAVGSGGSALTAVKASNDAGAITGSARVGDTTPGTPGDIVKGFQWEQLGPLGLIYTPEMRITLELSTGIALVCNTAVAFTMSGFICWEEI